MAVPLDAFDALGNDWRPWRRTAEDLSRAAEVLREHRYHQQEHGAPFMWARAMHAELLLWGYAVEVFLKCLYLRRGNSLFRDGGYKGPQHHRLALIADTVGCSLTAPQRDLLDRLSQYVLWVGRYPMATRLNTFLEGTHWNSARDDSALDALIESLRSEIDSN